jgi:hypothetical protein
MPAKANAQGAGMLAAVDCATGKLVWRQELSKLVTGGFAYNLCSSPVLYKDLVIMVLVTGGQSATVGFDRKTGELKYRQPRPRLNWGWLPGQNSPVPALIKGVPFILDNTSSSTIEGIDPEDGKIVWFASQHSESASLAVGDGMVQLIRQGRRLGKNQWRVPLKLAPQLRRHYNDPTLPRTLWVRLIRVRYRRGTTNKELWLVTTLMDPTRYPKAQIARLYRTRWGIEGRIGELKTTLQMNVLRGKSPAAVRREAASIILGHNLVWTLIHQATEATQTPARDISFAGAVKTVVAFSPALRHATPTDRAKVYAQMLMHIARQTNHHPFDRVEPRLIKREVARFAYLREPRRKARFKCLS